MHGAKIENSLRGIEIAGCVQPLQSSPLLAGGEFLRGLSFAVPTGGGGDRGGTGPTGSGTGGDSAAVMLMRERLPLTNCRNA